MWKEFVYFYLIGEERKCYYNQKVKREDGPLLSLICYVDGLLHCVALTVPNPSLNILPAAVLPPSLSIQLTHTLLAWHGW